MKASKYFGLSLVALTTVANVSIAQAPLGKVGVPQPANSIANLNAPVNQKWIRVRNLQPSVLAWMMQPDRHEKPLMFRTPGGDRQTLALPPIKMPSGLTAIAPVDAQNSLLVLGSDAAITQIEKLLTFLDKPLQQVEVEAIVLQFDNFDDAKTLGIHTNSAEKPRLGAIKKSYAEYQGELKRLAADGRVKIVSSSRVTTINNVPASLSTGQETPSQATPNADGSVAIGPRPKDGVMLPMGSALGLVDAFEFLTTPTINSDESITLMLQLGRVVRLRDVQNGDSVRLYSPSNLQTVAKVRDGETLVLGGFSMISGIQGTLNGEEPPIIETKTGTTVYLVTARIIRRLEDAEAKTNKGPIVTVPNAEWKQAMEDENNRRAAEKATP